MGLDDLQYPALHFRMSARGKPERSNHEKFRSARATMDSHIGAFGLYFPSFFYLLSEDFSIFLLNSSQIGLLLFWFQLLFEFRGKHLEFSEYKSILTSR